MSANISFTAEKATKLVLETASELFDDVTVDVERGEQVTKDAEGVVTNKKKGFRVGFAKGDDIVYGFGVKIESALKACLRAAGYGTIEDFTFDTESEFFAAAPKDNADKDNPWAREDAQELRDMRSAVQGEVSAAVDDSENAQSHWLKVSEIVKSAYEKLGRKSAVIAWAKGEDGDTAAPWLAALGDSYNALNEACAMANLSQVQFAHLHVNINRGKAILLEISKGAADYMAGAAEAALASGLETEMVGEVERYTMETIAEAMAGAIDSAGVAEDYEDMATGLALLQDTIDSRVKAAAAAGVTKHCETDEERAVLRDIIGLCALHKWLNEAYDTIKLMSEIAKLPEKDRKKPLATAQKALYGGAFYTRLSNAITKVSNERAGEAKKQGAVKAAAEAEPLQGAKKLMESDARTVASRIWASFKDHPQYIAVLEEVTIMARDQKRRDDAAERAAAKAAE